MMDRFPWMTGFQLEHSDDRSRSQSGVLRAIFVRAIVLVSMVAVAGSAQVAEAATGVITSVELFKAIDRNDGVPIPGTPYFVELCASGPDIASASVTVNGGSAHDMILLEGTEFCFEQGFANFAELDAAFPVGTYVVSVTDGSSNSDTATVDFQATEPTAYADYSFPPAAGTLPAGSDIPVTWTLTNKSSCDTNSPESCTDGFLVIAIDELLDDDVFLKSLTPVASGTLLPGDIFVAGLDYSFELETFEGTLSSTMSTQMGDTIPFRAIFEDINAIAITSVAPTVISSVEFFKGVDRENGVLNGPSYFAEFCVVGPGLDSATLAVGAGAPTAMAQVDPDEFCLEPAPFESDALMNAAFPSGNYTVSATNNSQATDSITLNFDVTEPGAFLDFVSPVHGGTISGEVDLPISWTMNGCAGAPSTCADGVLLAIGDEQLDEDVDIQLMVPQATNTTVSADVLAADTSYFLELATQRGTLVTADVTDGGKSIGVIAIYESINSIQVPEPGAVLQSGVALAALGLLASIRSRSRVSKS